MNLLGPTCTPEPTEAPSREEQLGRVLGAVSMLDADEPPSCLAGGVTTRADVAPFPVACTNLACPNDALPGSVWCAECGGER